jgi:hypothetical protein
MNLGVAIHSDEAPDRKRLLFSLAGALLIASLAFALVFWFFAWLPYQTMAWLDTLPPAKASHILKMISIFTRAIAISSGLFTSVILLAIVAHKQRSKPAHPIKLTRKRLRDL